MLFLATCTGAYLSGFAGQYALVHTNARAAVTMQGPDDTRDPGGTLMPGDNSLDPAAGNFRRLSDKLKEADIERRLEQEQIDARENAAKLAREARERKIQLMKDIPDAQKAGTVDDYMYKEGVKDIR